MQLLLPVSILLMLIVEAAQAQTVQQQVDQLFAAFDKPDSPGCSLGVIQDGAFLYRKSYGAASLELGVPLSSRSVFYLASVSKQFTAASVVLASEQGLLSLDDEVHRYIPELPDYGSPITLRQMLHHTSGFRNALELIPLSGHDVHNVLSTSARLDLITRQKALNFPPGALFEYSNTNYALLAEIIKRATKKPLSLFAAENIFEPLAMAHTRFYDDHKVVVPGRVPAYSVDKTGFRVNWSTNFDNVGDGGVMSTIDDLFLWDKNFYNNRLGKGTLLKELQTPGVLNNGKSIAYALGLFMNTYRGLSIIEHPGILFGYNTEILRFPTEHFTVLCLCNLVSADAPALSRKVADIYLAQRLQPVPATPPGFASISPKTPRFAGKYFDPKNHATYSFHLLGEKLAFAGLPLRLLDASRFELLGSVVEFDDSNSPTKLRIRKEGKVVFAGSRVESHIVSPADLSAVAGTYASAELNTTYKLTVQNGTLLLQSNWNSPVGLTPLAPDDLTVRSEDISTEHWFFTAVHLASCPGLIFSLEQYATFLLRGRNECGELAREPMITHLLAALSFGN